MECTAMAEPDRRPPDARAAFFLYLASLQRPKVLELGTKRSIPDRGTSHKEEILRFNPTAVHVGADVEPGLDVDVVVDAHRLTENFPRATFDAFIAASVFEHLRWPWLAALELNRVLKVGGIGFVQSHQSFPIHAYPADYWRFSTEAWGALFCPDMCWRVVSANYDFPCRVVPLVEVAVWNETSPSYLNSSVCVQKTAEVSRGRFRWRVDLDAAVAVGSDPNGMPFPQAPPEPWWYTVYRRLAPLVPRAVRRRGRRWLDQRAARG